ncbi:hypothetical protein [Ruania halotolerans]|uniref:hypothetical protein n=1 Tax=Ruania halotolerans TaxID=2897773 RepID=UPI001E463102|nr:hypothetical protein [Ruania halotolerans]UFU07693.1 hypothetical protein LQF10_06230 [Ruania halotolerans]
MSAPEEPNWTFDSPTDPFGGRYRDQGSASFAFGGGGPRRISGSLLALGHLLGWLAVVVPVLLLGLVGVTFLAVEYGWVRPPDAPSFPISALVIGAIFLSTAITAGIGRTRVRRLTPVSGFAWFVVAAAFLIGGTAWMVNVHGIPL